jgi:hypothetical protein
VNSESTEGENGASERSREEHDVARTSLRKLFRAAADLKDDLSISEEMFLGLAPEAQPDQRDLVVFEALDEIQKMCTALLPLTETYSSADEAEDVPGDATTRIIKEALEDQSALWQRKLAELLAELIAFRTTNEPDYYRDYVLLARLDQVLGAQADQSSFWGSESSNFAAQIADLRKRVADIEPKLDLQRAWYRARPRPLGDSASPGQLFASFRRRLRVALEEGEDAEKVALGLTYDSVFGRTSANIHGRPGRMEAPQRGSKMGDLQIPILIGINVLIGAQRLVDKVPGEHNKFFRRAIERNAMAAQVIGRVTDQRAEVGDVVFVHGELGEVLDVTSGPFGYKSYRVRYLTRRLLPDVEEDNVVSPQVALVLNVDQARSMLREQVEAGTMPAEVAEQMAALADDKLVAAFRESMVQLWSAGVGFKEALTARVTKPPNQDS